MEKVCRSKCDKTFSPLKIDDHILLIAKYKTRLMITHLGAVLKYIGNHEKI